jgi:hypothetical protein
MNNNSCYDTSSVSTLVISDTCLVISEVLDTITYFDTLIVTETTYDTLIYSTIDTLIIETLITSVTPPQFNDFIIYPNPAHTFLTINCGNISILNGYSIKILSLSGQIVFNQNIIQQETTINLGNWSNGIYHIKIFDSLGNSIATKQILIN